MSRGRPRACVITGFGINADEELALALAMAGAEAGRVHVSDLIEDPSLVGRYRILAFPGGFSFGDHLGSGMVFAHLFRRHLKPALEGFVAAGGLVIGICNGFQVLVKMGVLPNMAGSWEPEVSLVHNDSGRVRGQVGAGRLRACKPLRVDARPAGHGPARAPWRGEAHREIRRGAGRSRGAAPRGSALRCARSRGAVGAASPAVPVAYPDNPNGSACNAAGICDSTGRIFGLMPHPEAFIRAENHPEWTRGAAGAGQGLGVFENGVRAARPREGQPSASLTVTGCFSIIRSVGPARPCPRVIRFLRGRSSVG